MNIFLTQLTFCYKFYSVWKVCVRLDKKLDIISRLYKQVWDLLQKMKERVTQQTWKREDQYIVEGLINILILSVRNNIISNDLIIEQPRKP